MFRTSRHDKGFTLIELMIVIAIIAIIAAIAIPNLLAARLSANETAAIATLRNIISAQAQYQQTAKADTDNDGTGEYGGFAEMSGGIAGRMSAVLAPPVLSGAFRVLNANGQVSRSGYFFRIYCPGAAGVGVGEPTAGYTAALLNADLTETTWCCYAWPVNYGQSGNRSFFTNQGGDLIATEKNTYSGTAAGPASDAAFKVSGAGKITGAVAIASVGNDGNTWKQVN
jgi:prepilin-type N-terminal cleavage/methylation domain-containing protein